MNLLKYIFMMGVMCCFLKSTSGQIEIPMEINDGGYLFVRVKLDDQDSARFLFDTGAGINIISGDLFQKMKDRLQETGMHTGTRHNGERDTGMLYQMSSLSVGNFKKTNVVVGKWDGINNCDGILSMNYFENTPVTIDFVNKKLIIETERSLSKIIATAERIPIRIFRNGKDETSYFATICLNGKIQADAEFDTGSGYNVLMLNPRYMDSVNMHKPNEDQNDYGYFSYSGYLPNLMYCRTSFSQNHVFVGFKEGLIYDALIGSGIFRDKKLTISISKSAMWVQH